MDLHINKKISDKCNVVLLHKFKIITVIIGSFLSLNFNQTKSQNFYKLIFKTTSHNIHQQVLIFQQFL